MAAEEVLMDRIAGVLTATWLQPHETQGRLPWLLLAHGGAHLPPEQQAAAADSLTAVCTELGLQPAAERLTAVGPRLTVRARSVTLDYGAAAPLRVCEPGAQWRSIARTRGEVMLAVGLEPLAAGSGGAAIDAYLCRYVPSGRVLLGVVSPA